MPIILLIDASGFDGGRRIRAAKELARAPGPRVKKVSIVTFQDMDVEVGGIS